MEVIGNSFRLALEMQLNLFLIVFLLMIKMFKNKL